MGQSVVDGRALLVRSIFRRYMDARQEFSTALERCATKGWPDRRTAARNSRALQALFRAQLAMRLESLLASKGSDDPMWDTFISTDKIHERLQEQWTEREDAEFRSRDTAYASLLTEIADAQLLINPEALDEPFRMAKRDPELRIAAARLDEVVRELDAVLAGVHGRVSR
jgi:hypothetical protein